MLEKPVKINGIVYDRHEIVVVEHEYENDVTIVRVKSSNETDTFISTVSTELDETATRESLYEYIDALPEFEAYSGDGDARADALINLLTDEQAEAVPVDYFKAWAEGVYYAVGARVRYGERIYRCLTAHTSQSDWTPDAAPSLWVKTRGEEPVGPDDPTPAIEEWEQPDSTNPYQKGDVVTHNGKTWESLIDNNVWEPGAVGTETLWKEIVEE